MDITEQNNRLLTFVSLKGIDFGKVRYRVNVKIDVSWQRHADDGFPEKISRQIVVGNDDASRFRIGNPRLENLTVHQSVINPHQGYVKRHLAI